MCVPGDLVNSPLAFPRILFAINKYWDRLYLSTVTDIRTFHITNFCISSKILKATGLSCFSSKGSYKILCKKYMDLPSYMVTSIYFLQDSSECGAHTIDETDTIIYRRLDRSMHIILM